MPGPNDPYSPDYAPEYGGSSDIGDVGSGPAFAADLYSLYYAGRVGLPDTALSYANLGLSVYDVRAQIRSVMDAGILEVSRLLYVQEDLNVGFAKTSEHCDLAGTALVRIADEYVRTDEEAAAGFNLWVEELSSPEERNRLADPPPDIPDVPVPEEVR